MQRRFYQGIMNTALSGQALFFLQRTDVQSVLIPDQEWQHFWLRGTGKSLFFGEKNLRLDSEESKRRT